MSPSSSVLLAGRHGGQERLEVEGDRMMGWYLGGGMTWVEEETFF